MGLRGSSTTTREEEEGAGGGPRKMVPSPRLGLFPRCKEPEASRCGRVTVQAGGVWVRAGQSLHSCARHPGHLLT